MNVQDIRTSLITKKDQVMTAIINHKAELKELEAKIKKATKLIEEANKLNADTKDQA